MRFVAAMGVALGLTLVTVACVEDGGDDRATRPAGEISTSTSGPAATTSGPAATPTSAAARPLSGTLAPHTEYTVGDTVEQLTITFRTGADGKELLLDYIPSGLDVIRTGQFVTAISVQSVAALEVYEVSEQAGTSVKPSPPPADLLGWLAARWFFEVVEPRRPFTAGEASGEIVTVRTKPLTAAPNPNACHPSVPVCVDLFRSRDGGTFTTSPGDMTDFAVVDAGGTKALVIASPDAAGREMLQSLKVSTG